MINIVLEHPFLAVVACLFIGTVFVFWVGEYQDQKDGEYW